MFRRESYFKPARLAEAKAPHPKPEPKKHASAEPKPGPNGASSAPVLRPKTTRKKAMKKKKPAASGLPVYFQGPLDPVLQGLRPIFAWGGG